MKKSISLFLALAMIFSLISVPVFATAEDDKNLVIAAENQQPENDDAVSVPDMISSSKNNADNEAIVQEQGDEYIPQEIDEENEQLEFQPAVSGEEGLAVAEESSGIYVVDNGICGDDLTYSLYSHGVLVIEGSSPMYDYTTVEDTPWFDNREDIVKVNMVSGKSVGNYAFYGFPNLKELQIFTESGLESIGQYAFAQCFNLTRVDINSLNCSSIGEGAFYQCVNLKYIYGGWSLEKVEPYTFFNCQELSLCPSGAQLWTEVGAYAFYGCRYLYCTFKLDSAISIGDYAFSGCNQLRFSETLPAVKDIGVYAFQNCYDLRLKAIADGILEIGEGSFMKCVWLEELTLPSSVTEIGYNAFANCENLTLIVSNDSTVLDINESAFSGTKSVKLHVPVSLFDEYCEEYANNGVCNLGITVTLKYGLIPGTYRLVVESNSSVDTIEMQGEENGDMQAYFPGESVTLTASQTESTIFDYWSTDDLDIAIESPSDLSITFAMPNHDLSVKANYIQVDTSERCGDRATWRVEQDILYITGMGPMYDWNATTLPPWYPQRELIEEVVIDSTITSIGQYAFYQCENLRIIELSDTNEEGFPSAITEIPAYSFYGCKSFKISALPENITSIGEYAFYNCEELAIRKLPEGITSIPAYAFYNCGKLALFYQLLSSQTLKAKVTEVGDYAFFNCSNINMNRLWSTLAYVGDYAFYNCQKLKAVVPYSVEIIGDYAFAYSGIVESFFPKTVSIGEAAFKECKSCRPSRFSETLIYIGKDAFSGCPGGTKLTIAVSADTETYIGAGAFSGCTEIQSIELSGAISLMPEVFQGCSSLESITFSGIVNIPDRAFEGCEKLTNCSLGNDLTDIGKAAFQGCKALTTITIPKNVSKLSPHTFRECWSLDTVVLSYDGVVDIPSLYEGGFGYPSHVRIPYNRYEEYMSSPSWGEATSTEETGYNGEINTIEYAQMIVTYNGPGTSLSVGRGITGSLNKWIPLQASIGVGDAFICWYSDDVDFLDPTSQATQGHIKRFVYNSTVKGYVFNVSVDAKKASGEIAESIPYKVLYSLPYGKALDELSNRLPTTVTAKMEDETTALLNVEWDYESYDPYLQGEHQTITGTYVLPEGVSNPSNVLAECTVIAGAKNIYINSIISLLGIEVDYETSTAELVSSYLPESLKVATTGNEELDLAVEWDISEFEPMMVGQQIIRGTFNCAENITNSTNYIVEFKVVILPPDEEWMVIAETEPESISVTQGKWLAPQEKNTEYGMIHVVPLPQTVSMNLVEGGQIDLPVSWDTGTYNAMQTGVQTIYGEIVLTDSDGVINPLDIKAELKINVQPREYIVSQMKVADNVSVEVLSGIDFDELNTILRQEEEAEVQINATDYETSASLVTFCSLLLRPEDNTNYDKNQPGEYTLLARVPENFISQEEMPLNPIPIHVTVRPRMVLGAKTTHYRVYQSIAPEYMREIPPKVDVLLEGDMTISVDVEWNWSTYSKNTVGDQVVVGYLKDLPSLAQIPDGQEVNPAMVVHVTPAAYEAYSSFSIYREGDAGLCLEELMAGLKPIMEPLHINKKTGQAYYSTYKAEFYYDPERNAHFDPAIPGQYPIYGSYDLPDNISCAPNYGMIRVTINQVQIEEIKPECLRVPIGTNFADIQDLPTQVSLTLSSVGVDGQHKKAMVDVDWGTGEGYNPDPVEWDVDGMVTMVITGNLVNCPQYIAETEEHPKLYITVVAPSAEFTLEEIISPINSVITANLGSSLQDIYDKLESHVVQLVLRNAEGETITQEETFQLREQDNPGYDPMHVCEKDKGMPLKLYIPMDSSIQNPDNLELVIKVELKKYNISKIGTVSIPKKPFGTEFKDLGLPEKVSVTCTDGVTEMLPVEWDSSKYNPNKEGAQAITGTLKTPLPVYLENPNNRQPKAAITLEKATTTGIVMSLRQVEKPVMFSMDGEDDSSIPGYKEYYYMAEILHEDESISYELISVYIEIQE